MSGIHHTLTSDDDRRILNGYRLCVTYGDHFGEGCDIVVEKQAVYPDVYTGEKRTVWVDVESMYGEILVDREPGTAVSCALNHEMPGVSE